MKCSIEKFETGYLMVNTWVFPLSEDTTAIIDPGGVSPELLQFLAKLNPHRLEIMLTHGHFDHVGGLPTLVRKYPDYRLWVHHNDVAYLGHAAKETHLKSFGPLRVTKLIEPLEADPLPEPTDFYKEGDRVNGFMVLHTPGHTGGSICLWSKENNILFSGDTLFYGSRGRTDLLDGNELQIRQSLKRLFNELPGNTLVYPGHGSETSIEFEKKYQGAYL